MNKGTLIFFCGKMGAGKSTHAKALAQENNAVLLSIEKRCSGQPERAATDTAAMFAQVTRYFVAPEPDEGFNVVRISG